VSSSFSLYAMPFICYLVAISGVQVKFNKVSTNENKCINLIVKICSVNSIDYS